MTNSDFHRSADSTELERSIEQLLFNKITSNRMAGFTVTVAHEIMGLVRKIGIPGVAQPDKVWFGTDRAALADRMKACAFYDFDSVEMVECKWAMWEEILNALAQPSPAATVETEPKDNRLIMRAFDALHGPDSRLSAASEPVAWLVTWTMKNNGPTASAYIRERDARDAARNVERYADASNVVVAPAYTNQPQEVPVTIVAGACAGICDEVVARAEYLMENDPKADRMLLAAVSNGAMECAENIRGAYALSRPQSARGE